jgi:hypothetical protein
MTIRVKLTRIGEMLSEIRLENSAGNDIYDNGTIHKVVVVVPKQLIQLELVFLDSV